MLKITHTAGIIGEGVDLSLEHLGDLRQSTVLFNLTRRLLYTRWRDPGEEPKLHLFGQLKRITREWLEGCLRCSGGTYPALLMYQELADLACERITAAITRAFVGERRIRVSTIDRRDRAVFCLTAFSNLKAFPLADTIVDYMSGYWAVRSMGGCQDAALVCSGRAEAWVELAAKAWDLAPFKVLAEEAGARFFNFDGGSSIHSGSAVICSPFLEEELRALVRSSA